MGRWAQVHPCLVSDINNLFCRCSSTCEVFWNTMSSCECRRNAAAGAAQKQPFRNQVNFSLELEHHLLSASGFRNVIASYTFFFPDRNGERNTDDDGMSSSASITETPTPKRAGGSRKPHSSVTSKVPTHKGEFYLASESRPGWDGVGQFTLLKLFFFSAELDKYPTKHSVTSVFLPR